MTAAEEQRRYYARTADQYEATHADPVTHAPPLKLLTRIVERHGVRTVLDVGAGTGRVWRHFNGRVDVTGVEPAEALREVGHQLGVPRERLVEGNGYALAFPDDSFDVVCAFGVMHHIPDPQRMVAEMLRVARLGVFIFDVNNFGEGPPNVRRVKHALHRLGLWKAAIWLKTRGRMYRWSEGDGLFYSYSIFTTAAAFRPRATLWHTSLGSDWRSVTHAALYIAKAPGHEPGVSLDEAERGAR